MAGKRRWNLNRLGKAKGQIEFWFSLQGTLIKMVSDIGGERHTTFYALSPVHTEQAHREFAPIETLGKWN